MFKSNLSHENFIARSGEFAKEYLSQLDGEYEKYKDSTITELSYSAFNEYFISGNRLKYENEYFCLRTLLRDFALKAWLGDSGATKRLENVMLAVCGEFTWALPAHFNGDTHTIDLFAAETAQTLSEILSLMQDRISGEVSEKCISEIKKRVIVPFVNRKSPYNWEHMKNNWCAVCGGCVGMTALYLIDDNMLLKNVTESLRPAFDSYISGFADDGACVEGLYYWNYGMMYFMAFLDLYKQRMCEDYPINENKVKKMAEFGCKCCISDGITVSFSDGCERDKIYSGLSCYLSREYNVSVPEREFTAMFLGDDCGRWCKAVRDIAWTDAYNIKSGKENVVLKKAQWTLIHSGNMSIAFKGGNNGELHNHNDVGNIMAVKNGKVILCDIGAGEYTAEYFSQKRSNIFCVSSKGHSVPIINGGAQKDGEKYGARDFAVEDGGARADISGAYGIDALKECVRTVSCGENEIIIKDDFKLCAELEITERFITRHSAIIENNVVKIISDDKTIGKLVTENICGIEIKTYKHHEHDGSKSDIASIDFTFKADGKYRFLVKVL